MYLSTTGSERGCWGRRNGKRAWFEWQIWWQPETANNETSAGQARSDGGYDCWAGSQVLQTKETENLQRKKEVIADSGMVQFWHCTNQTLKLQSLHSANFPRQNNMMQICHVSTWCFDTGVPQRVLNDFYLSLFMDASYILPVYRLFLFKVLLLQIKLIINM